MARALQCPACGTKKRIDALTEGASFQCEQCGQVLKVPPSMQARPKPAAPAPGPSSAPPRQPATSGGAPPPAPRRRSRPTMTAGGVAAGAGGAAVLSGDPSPVGPSPASPAPVSSAPVSSAAGGRVIVAPPRDSAPAGSGTAGTGRREDRDALPLPVRILAWVVALPLGLAIVGIPARKAGYLSSQKLLDVIVKSDLSRFVPIVVIILLWALVSAILVTLFVEGGRRFMARRHAKRDDRASPAPTGGIPARGGRPART